MDSFVGGRQNTAVVAGIHAALGQKEAPHVRYLVRLSRGLPRTWFRAVLPWPRAGPFPVCGLEGFIWSCPCPRRQGGSRQGGGCHSADHSARPVAWPSRAKLPRGGGSLCPHRRPGRPHRPSCAQAWHTAGSWPAHLSLCLAFPRCRRSETSGRMGV
jgi:hypothetical protein